MPYKDLEKRREMSRRSKAKYRDRDREEKNAYLRKNWKKRGEQYNTQARQYRSKIKQETMDAYGGECVCCGETFLPFLTLDHIDGRRDEGKSRGRPGGVVLYRQARNEGYPDTFRVLCFNCNAAVHHYGQDVEALKEELRTHRRDTMAKVMFPDGTSIEADTWEELEEHIRENQFIEYSTPQAFREEMARRADLWSEADIMTNGSSQDFLYELERAEMLSVVLRPQDRPKVRLFKAGNNYGIQEDVLWPGEEGGPSGLDG